MHYRVSLHDNRTSRPPVVTIEEAEQRTTASDRVWAGIPPAEWPSFSVTIEALPGDPNCPECCGTGRVACGWAESDCAVRVHTCGCVARMERAA